jgi:hypothetical protein
MPLVDFLDAALIPDMQEKGFTCCRHIMSCTTRWALPCRDLELAAQVRQWRSARARRELRRVEAAWCSSALWLRLALTRAAHALKALARVWLLQRQAGNAAC